MNPIALLSGQPPLPNPQEFRRAKMYGFWCEVCTAAYTLFVPEGFSFEQAKACQTIRAVCVLANTRAIASGLKYHSECALSALC
jgi:hypothetical protein